VTTPDLAEAPGHKSSESNRIAQLPAGRSKTESLELEREPVGIGRDHLGEKLVDPVAIGAEDLLFLLPQDLELGVQFNIRVPGRPDEPVGGQRPLAEDLGQAPAGGSAVQLQLPESVLGDDKAVGLEQAAVGFGEDVRNPEIVATDDRPTPSDIERRRVGGGPDGCGRPCDRRCGDDSRR